MESIIAVGPYSFYLCMTLNCLFYTIYVAHSSLLFTNKIMIFELHFPVFRYYAINYQQTDLNN